MKLDLPADIPTTGEKYVLTIALDLYKIHHDIPFAAALAARNASDRYRASPPRAEVAERLLRETLASYPNCRCSGGEIPPLWCHQRPQSSA